MSWRGRADGTVCPFGRAVRPYQVTRWGCTTNVTVSFVRLSCEFVENMIKQFLFGEARVLSIFHRERSWFVDLFLDFRGYVLLIRGSPWHSPCL